MVDPENVVVERTLELALVPIEEAAGGPVKGLIGNSDTVRAVREAIGAERFEEVSSRRFRSASRVGCAVTCRPGSRGSACR